MNLLSNAAKYKEKDRKNIWVELVESNGGYTITVADDGFSISDTMKQNQLNPERRSGGVSIHQCVHVTGKYRGAFEILDRIDGDHSQGTKFRIWIPKAGN